MEMPCNECLIVCRCNNITTLQFFSKILPKCSDIRDYLDIQCYTNTMCYHGKNIDREESSKRFKEAEEVFKIKFFGD